MDPVSKRRAWLAAVVVAVVAGIAAVLLTGDDEEAAEPPPVASPAVPERASPVEGPGRSRDAPATGSGRERDRERAGGGRSPLEEAIGPSQRPSGAAERGAVRAVEAYVEALDRRDGEAACALLAPGALEGLELPGITKGGCAGSLEASIGYRNPRGSPVWEGAEVEAIQSTSVEGREARVVATVVTSFADRDEPSVEDDVVYLVQVDGRWLVAKPSATLYRAVGYPDVPPSALAPPG